MHSIRWSLFASSCVMAAPLAAQDIPPYVPANPVLASRSALYAQPFVSRSTGTQWRVVTDYYNAVEVARSSDAAPRQYVMDAEILQSDLWVTRDLSSKIFVVGNLSVRGGYDGALDGFLNWYHRVIGIAVPARDELPTNVYQWFMQLPDTVVIRERPGTFIGDVRAGVGLRLGHAQVVATVTLPTGSVKADGFTRKTVGTSIALTDELVRNSRFVVDLSASAGVTPPEGALAKYQRSTFASGLATGRWRFAGQQALFSSVWVQSSNWKNTGFLAMEKAEVSMDAGLLLRIKHGWPELQIGMTQDLVPKGPAMDVGFTVGLRW